MWLPSGDWETQGWPLKPLVTQGKVLRKTYKQNRSDVLQNEESEQTAVSQGAPLFTNYN